MLTDESVRGIWYAAFYLSLLCALLVLLLTVLDLWFKALSDETPTFRAVYRCLRDRLAKVFSRDRTKGSCSSDVTSKGLKET